MSVQIGMRVSKEQKERLVELSKENKKPNAICIG